MELERISQLLKKGLDADAESALKEFLLKNEDPEQVVLGLSWLAQLYSKLGQHENAIAQLSQIPDLQKVLKAEDVRFERNQSYSSLLELLWRSCVAAGELDNADKVAAAYINFAIERKFIDRGIDFIKEIGKYKKNYSKEECLSLVRLNCFKGDLGEVAKVLPQIKMDASQQYDLACFIDHEMEKVGASKELTEFILKSCLLKLNTLGQQVVTARRVHKRFLNNAYQYLLRYPQGIAGILIIFDYAKKYHQGCLLKSLVEFCQSNQDDQVIQKVQGIDLNELDSGDKDSYELSELDLGEDLFLEEDENTRIKSLERDIKYLLKKGLLEEAKSLAGQLELYDSENTLLMDITRTKEFELFGIGKRRRLQDVEQDLLNRISMFTEIKKDEPLEFASLNKIIDYYSEEEFVDFYMDLLVAFLSMRCEQAAFRVIKRVDKDIIGALSFKEKLAYEYLRLTVYYDFGQLHQALARCEEIVRTWPLKNDEKAVFLYFIGEIYLGLNKDDLALGAFLGVSALAPGYRMVDLRIRDLERGQ